MTEEDKLVAYFNTPEAFREFGQEGDSQNWTPAETAIKAMQECIGHRKLNRQRLQEGKF